MLINNSYRRAPSHGFTIVEMLVIAPIVILTIGIFVTVIVSITGEVLASRSSNVLAYSIQDALNRIEEDVKSSTTFLEANHITPLTSPQGYNDGTDNFSNVDAGGKGNMLILNAQATTGNPLATTSRPVYLDDQPNDCLSTKFNQNTPMTMNVVYFIKDTKLWRRTITPSNYLTAGGCGIVPWQQPSCTTVAGPFCKAQDALLVDGVTASDFVVQYFNTADETVANSTASNAGATAGDRYTALQTTTTVGVTINATKAVAGRDVSQSGTIRATIDTSATTPILVDTVVNTPVPSWNSLSLQNNWYNYNNTFATGAYLKTNDSMVVLKGLLTRTGTAVSGETIGTLPVGYRPSEQLIFQTGTNPGVASRVDIYPDGTIKFIIGSGGWLGLDGINFLPATSPYTFNPLTPLLNGWLVYGSPPWAAPAYAIDASGRVHTKGLVGGGVNSGDTPVTTLPVGVRPASHELISVDNSNANGLIGIDSGGTITARASGNSYLSLQAMFYPSSYAGWTTPVLQNGWVAFPGWSTPRYTKSADGMVVVKGLIQSGTTTSGTVLTTLPPGYRPNERLLMGISSQNVFGRVDVLPSGEIIAVVIPIANGWISLDSVAFMAEQ
ncbi:hypothetical protein H7X69_00165 [Candidatus Saccharibacteria bacterium]|nr:hypothetical protein [Candidatus Saccharibacteria bacterium]